MANGTKNLAVYDYLRFKMSSAHVDAGLSIQLFEDTVGYPTVQTDAVYLKKDNVQEHLFIAIGAAAKACAAVGIRMDAANANYFPDPLDYTLDIHIEECYMVKGPLQVYGIADGTETLLYTHPTAITSLEFVPYNVTASKLSGKNIQAKIKTKGQVKMTGLLMEYDETEGRV